MKILICVDAILRDPPRFIIERMLKRATSDFAGRLRNESTRHARHSVGSRKKKKTFVHCNWIALCLRNVGDRERESDSIARVRTRERKRVAPSSEKKPRPDASRRVCAIFPLSPPPPPRPFPVGNDGKCVWPIRPDEPRAAIACKRKKKKKIQRVV